MHIGVLSDSHGVKHAMKAAVKTLDGLCKIERFLHAGDYARDGEYLKELTNRHVDFVCGNCDGMFTEVPVDQYVTIHNKLIWVTHGHMQRVKYDLKQLIREGREANVDIIVYGHTHIPDITWESNMLIFNPGSSYYGGINEPTCGILTVEETGAVAARIIKI